MKPIEDKGCCNYGPSKDISSSNAISFEFPKGNGTNRSSHHRTALGKPTPSKWDDAQKWLVGLSRGGEKNQSKTKPRNSNADDRRLIAPVPMKEKDYSDEGEEDDDEANGCGGETKKVDCDESFWQINKHLEDSTSAVRSICVRDMGTEMTPIASQEPSRTATPIRATTPVARSPISSGSSTPGRCCQTGLSSAESRGEAVPAGRRPSRISSDGEELNACKMPENKNSEHGLKPNNPLDTRASAWDEAERAKYLARYKREEVKIQAWENHEKRKAETEMRRMEASSIVNGAFESMEEQWQLKGLEVKIHSAHNESQVKAEKLKARAQEKLSNKLAATRRIAEEKRAYAEAKLNEKAARTSERADYIRRTGHLPSSFYFKLPSSLCW